MQQTPMLDARQLHGMPKGCYSSVCCYLWCVWCKGAPRCTNTMHSWLTEHNAGLQSAWEVNMPTCSTLKTTYIAYIRISFFLRFFLVKAPAGASCIDWSVSNTEHEPVPSRCATEWKNTRVHNFGLLELVQQLLHLTLQSNLWRPVNIPVGSIA